MTIRTTRLGPGRLTITAVVGGLTHEFASQVTQCELVPSVKTGDPIEVLSGEQIPGDRTETWAIKGKLVDDFGSVDSSVEFCFTNRGKQASFDFVPSTQAGKKVTGTLVVEATSIGGDVGKTNQVDFEFQALNPQLAAVSP